MRVNLLIVPAFTNQQDLMVLEAFLWEHLSLNKVSDEVRRILLFDCRYLYTIHIQHDLHKSVGLVSLNQEFFAEGVDLDTTFNL